MGICQINVSLYQLHCGKASCFSGPQRVYLFCFDSKSDELLLQRSYLHTNRDQYYCNSVGFNFHILRLKGTREAVMPQIRTQF
jgi:hypothetical protein